MNPFATVAGKRTKRSKFDLSHEKKMSIDMGGLYPCLLQEVVPGDKFRVNTEVMMRFAPMIAPVMHRMNTFVHYFFVPNRLTWDNWESFITGGRDGAELPVFPTLRIEEGTKNFYTKASLADYLGIPPVDQAITMTNTVSVSALPFRAYQLIFQEYYQDQNLAAELAISKADGRVASGAEITKLNTLRTRAYEKDYFTSALPWPQRGGSVSTPVDYMDHVKLKKQDGTNAPVDTLSSLSSGGETWLGDTTGVSWLTLENIDGIDINELRKSARLQEWLERQARAGSRYIETILSHFGVKSSDKRLQRPEYLGGGRQPVVISEVLNTTGTTDNPQGNMSGHGISVGAQNRFSRSFEEHGYIIGIMSVVPKTAYQDGIHRHWLRNDKFDYYWPEFAQLGEQEIYEAELFTNYADLSTAKNTWAYTPRYAEYKYGCSTVHGDFRDNLDHWHLGRKFSALPPLNENFITAVKDDRIFAVENDQVQKLWIQLFNRVDAIRPMPYFNNPKL